MIFRVNARGEWLGPYLRRAGKGQGNSTPLGEAVLENKQSCIRCPCVGALLELFIFYFQSSLSISP